MQLAPCANCGHMSFTGSVVVTFNNVPITVDLDGSASPDWMEGFASEDEIIAATCTDCGTEAK